jgi:hypothetical protein
VTGHARRCQVGDRQTELAFVRQVRIRSDRIPPAPCSGWRSRYLDHRTPTAWCTSQRNVTVNSHPQTQTSVKPSPRAGTHPPTDDDHLIDRLFLRLTGHDLGTAPTRVYLTTVSILSCLLLAGAGAGEALTVHCRRPAEPDVAILRKTFPTTDPVGAHACALINDWLRGGGQEPLRQAFDVATRARDEYIRLEAGSGYGMQVAGAAAGAVMYRPG